MRSSVKLVAVSALLACFPRAGKADNLDLTASTNLYTVDRTYTYNLGPTGMRGWIYHAWSVVAGHDDTTAFAPYQILVTAVGTNTPASGILATNDVILGAGAGSGAVPAFTNDARKSLGYALTAAEAGDGLLRLKRWRAGVSTDVALPLQSLGSYSATAPYNCPKTALILTNAAESIQRRVAAKGWLDSGSKSISALALLATGNTNYLPMLQTYARALAPPALNLEQSGGISAWDCYNSVFLAEYYMLTGDAEVFHGLSEYVIYAATHQSMYGTAGHGFSNVPPPGGWAAGGTHGSMSWYGPVNQAGLVAQLSIVLGKTAGVVSPEIDPAIGRAAKFFGYYVNRGSVPYGEHQPYFGEIAIQGQSRYYYDHASNGKDALAAVMFACMGDKPVQTEFYTRMSVAACKGGEEYGHTGQGFSYLWTTLGANVGGTNAVSEFLKQVLWHRDLTRRCDGSFAYDGGEQFGCSSASDYWAYTSYYDNPTAYYLLHAALPLKKLYITGKNADPANRLSSQVVSNALWAAAFASRCGGYTTNQLVAALGEWDPIVRFNAATELSVRSGGAALIPLLNVMAENPTNASQREAACTALGCMGAASAVPALVRRLSDTDLWVRAKAAKALTALGTTSASSVPDMLAAFVTNVVATYPFEAGFNWDDPLQISNGYLAETLFDKLGGYTISADKSLLYPAVRAGIRQPAGMWRGKLDGFVQNRLTLADVKALIPELLEDARTEGPCDRMFTVTPPAAAMNVLAKYHIQEGAEVCFGNVAYWGGVLGATAISRLAEYGEAARWTLPYLYADLETWKHDNNYAALVSTAASLEAATTSPALLYGLAVADPQVVATPSGTARALTLTGSSVRTNVLSYAIASQPEHGTLTGAPPNVTYTPAAGYQGVDRFTFTVADNLTLSAPAAVTLVVGTGGTGLKGLYFDNMDFTSLKATVTNRTINFDWGLAAPTNAMGADTYSVRWTGQVLAPESGAYRFSARASDGVRLWVNGVQVLNDWSEHTVKWNDSAPVALTAGQKYSLKMEYYRNANSATARLYGYIPSRQAAMIIPQELLYPASGVSLTSPLNGARFGLPAGLPAAVTLTADASDAGGTVTNVAFYSGDELIGSDATPPYSAVWTNVKAGQYSLTARATTSDGEVSLSAVAVISVDVNTVPVTTNLACWFEAGAGVTTDADGVIQAWSDQSGNAHHASLASGSPVLAPNQLNSKPSALFRGHATWFDIAGAFFTKEQYIVVRSPNATWSGSGSFLGRKSTGVFLEARASSYNLYNGYTGLWDDQLPAAVSKNGTAVSSGHGGMPRGGFELGAITNYMLLKITVQGTVSNTYYQVGQNDSLGSSEWDLAEIIGYATTLSSNDEALVGSYLAAKYGIGTVYPGHTNTPPQITEGAAASVTLSEDGSPTPFSLTLHATDAETNTLSWSVSAQPLHGTASASGTGTVKAIGYTPAADFSGTDGFTVRVSDSYGGSDTLSVTVTIQPVNDAPVAHAQSVSTPVNTAKAVTLAGSDIENSLLTYAIMNAPAHGSLSGTPPDVTYTPAAGYTGFDAFTFKVNDGMADSASAAVSVTVTLTNRAPVAAAQSAGTPKNTAKALTLTGSDADGDPLTYAVVTGPAHGTLSGALPAVTYTPAIRYIGPDAFTFKVNDGSADSAPATVSLTVTFVATPLAEDFEHEWADNALANATNRWTSSGAGDLSSITNPSAGYAASPGRVPFPLSYNHSVQRRLLSLSTGGDLLATPRTDADFSNTTVYVDMMVKFMASEALPVAATNDPNMKVAVLLLADGAATNLCVCHGRKEGGGFGGPAVSVVTNRIAPETWCRLTVDLSSTAGAEAFRVQINGQALSSPAAYGDDWKDAVFTAPYTPSGGTWFLSAARRAASGTADPDSIGNVRFLGTGGIDDLVVTYDKPDFTQGIIFMLVLCERRGEME